MVTSRFKIGDRVVVVKSDWSIPVGTVLIISGYDYYNNFLETFPIDRRYDGSSDPWTEYEIELEEIYNSPLYQLMREE